MDLIQWFVPHVPWSVCRLPLRRPDVLAFGANLEADLFWLQHERRSFTCEPGAYLQFMVREPQPRVGSGVAAV